MDVYVNILRPLVLMYTCWFILQLLCLHNCCFKEKKGLFEQYYVNMLLGPIRLRPHLCFRLISLIMQTSLRRCHGHGTWLASSLCLVKSSTRNDAKETPSPHQFCFLCILHFPSCIFSKRKQQIINLRALTDQNINLHLICMPNYSLDLT